MCMVVYVASDYPLPTRAWDASCPRFHVTELDERGVPVRGRFTKPRVYYVGSHERCGCGFQFGEYEGFEAEDDLPQKQQSRRLLAEFLAVALQHQAEVELFACWSGDEGQEPEHRGRVRPADLLQTRTFFRERELLIVSEGSAA
jgi:hypothetical protein